MRHVFAELLIHAKFATPVLHWRQLKPTFEIPLV